MHPVARVQASYLTGLPITFGNGDSTIGSLSHLLSNIIYVYGKNKRGWDLRIAKHCNCSSSVSTFPFLVEYILQEILKMLKYDFIKHSFILGSFVASDVLLIYTQIRSTDST